jgi:uncharacterized protein YndB with AHSA1/START domain
MASASVERKVWINAPRERVWQAITDAAQINQWWGGDDHWEIDSLQVGGVVRFGHVDDVMTASIAVCDPPREFSIAWPPQPGYHQISMTTRYLLETENGGTRLTVSETGFDALPETLRQKRIEQTALGYEQVLAGLQAYLEGRKVEPGVAVQRTIWVKAPVERVWQSVTSPEQLAQWYAPDHTWKIPALDVGGRVEFHNSATEILQATIEDLTPPQLFSLRWDAHDGAVLLTTFMLEAENQGTRVTIVESGYEGVPADSRQAWLDAAGNGYSVSLEHLKASLEGRS